MTLKLFPVAITSGIPATASGQYDDIGIVFPLTSSGSGNATSAVSNNVLLSGIVDGGSAKWIGVPVHATISSKSEYDPLNHIFGV